MRMTPRLFRGQWLAVVCLIGPLCGARPARAQFPILAADLSEPPVSLFVTPSIHWGNPQKASLEIGAHFVARGPRYAAGPFATIEPGVGATRESLGYVLIDGSNRNAGRLSIAFLQTKARPWNAAAHAHYWGAQAQVIPRGLVGLRAGIFRRTAAGLAGTSRNQFTLDASLAY